MATRETMTISLPPELKEWIENLVKAGGYASVSEYIREMVRQDRIRRDKERISARLLEAIESGPTQELTTDFWDQVRRESEVLAAQLPSRPEKMAG